MLQRDEQNAAGIEKTVLLLLAIALNVLELFVPRIPLFPWLKPGIANCVTIVWIVRYGAVDAVLFSLVRVWIAGFYSGFSFLTLALALSGGIASTIVMGIAWSLFGRRGWLGAIGLGIIGAMAHNMGQLAMVYLLLAHAVQLWYQMPLMIAASLVFGGLTGAIAPVIHVFRPAAPAAALPAPTPARAAWWPALLTLAFSIILVFVTAPIALGACAIAATIAAQIAARWSWRALVYPARRFWLLFLCIGLLYAFFSYGKRIEGLPGVTYEGLHDLAVQWLRLWSWLELTVVFERAGFHTLILGLLRHAFPMHGQTLQAGVAALSMFPRIFAVTKGLRKGGIFASIRHPRMFVMETMRMIEKAIE